MFIDLQGCFAAPAARYFPNDGKVPKGSPGDAAGANFVRHDGLPPVPHYGGRIPVRSCNSSGAQNLSGFPPHLPAHWGLGEQKFQVPRLHFCAWVWQADGTGSVDGGRPKGLPYPIPEKFLRTVGAAPCGRPRAGLGPAPTKRTHPLRYSSQAFSLPGRRCRAYARRMRLGSGMAVALRRAGQCPAPTKKKGPFPNSPQGRLAAPPVPEIPSHVGRGLPDAPPQTIP